MSINNKINHDLDLLPSWGPYTKKYIGTSHIADKNHGIRFDLSIFPGFYRRKNQLPNVMFETDFYPWQASSDLHYFTFRHMLEWKDQIYCDIAYMLENNNCQLFCAALINNTTHTQSLCLHLLSSIHFASKKEYEPDNTLKIATINLSNNAKWLNSNQYTRYITQKICATDNLNPDGKFKHEYLKDGFIYGSSINFAISRGDCLSYQINQNEQAITLGIRYQAEKATRIELNFNGQESITLELTACDSPQICYVKPNALNEFSLIAIEDKLISIDGFIYGNDEEVNNSEINLLNLDTEAEIISYQDGFIIKYPQLEHYYALKFFADEFEQREFISDKPDTFFAQNANDHVKKLIIDENSHQHYSNWFLRPLHLKAKTKQDIYGLVANGSLSEMQNLLLDYGNAEIIAEKFSQITPTMSQPLGQQLLSASNFTNVVYPIYTAGEFIRHSTPGRWWDCLYTWDSGFIGLGLLESDIERAKENLLVYLTPANAENAFIHHGSPVPVQFYLIQEIYNKSGDIDFIHAIYPRLKQYYLFLAGKLGSSDTNRLGSNLLQTWSYFYNSGGWDDYPAQKYCHDKRLVLDTTPAITTSQVIRMAKILFGFATILSYPDTEEYTLDIEQMSQALINYSWDASSGYFSYVQHPKMQHLQAEDGSNFNQGLDGLYPLVAGVGNPQQQQMMISHLKNPDELWTTVGISAVSRRASYYRNDGYWNGTVWFAHQWLFWKAMFDVGESEFADKIAQTALELWENECQLTYRSLEHFVIYSGRGAGWHSFSGLSCPIINWYHAYFTPGRINCGFDCLITKYESDNNIITLEIRKFNNKTSSILIVRPAGWKKLSAKINGVASELTPSFSSQAFWISLPQAEQIKLTLEG